MPRRSGLTGPPRSYLVAGSWPDGRVDDPLAARAQELARRVRSAADGLTLRDLADRAGLDHTTVLGLLSGTRWVDIVVVHRLEVALGVDLWPPLHG